MTDRGYPSDVDLFSSDESVSHGGDRVESDCYSSEVADQSENRRPSMGDVTNKTLGAETQLILDEIKKTNIRLDSVQESFKDVQNRLQAVETTISLSASSPDSCYEKKKRTVPVKVRVSLHVL